MGSWDNEKAPNRRTLLPVGWRNFTITDCIKTVSKKGNPQFKMTLTDDITVTTTDVYAVAMPGKRWTLKCILDSVGVEKQEADDYDYSPELLGQKLSALVEHEPNDYINRQGEEVKGWQHRLVDFNKHGFAPVLPPQVEQPKEVEWTE